MSAIDTWKVTERALKSQGMTLHNLGNDIWEVADQMQAAIAEMEAELEKANRRKANTEWNALVRQSDENLARAEQAEAELAKFKSQLCGGCGMDTREEARTR